MPAPEYPDTPKTWGFALVDHAIPTGTGPGHKPGHNMGILARMVQLVSAGTEFACETLAEPKLSYPEHLREAA